MNSFYESLWRTLESFCPRISAAMPLGNESSTFALQMLIQRMRNGIWGRWSWSKRKMRKQRLEEQLSIIVIPTHKERALFPAQRARATHSNGEFEIWETKQNSLTHQNLLYHLHFHWLCQMQFAMQPMRTAKLFQNKMCAMWPAVPPATRAFLILLITELRQ